LKSYRKDPPVIKLTEKDWRMKLKGIWYDISLSSLPLCRYGHFIGKHELYDDIQLKAEGLSNDHGGAYV